MVRMPIADWADERDVGYRRWKKKVPMPPPPVQAQPELCEKVSAKLAELPKLPRGGTCLNEWGGALTMLCCCALRAFTVVKGVRFGEVVAYLGIEATQMTDYRRHARWAGPGPRPGARAVGALRGRWASMFTFCSLSV